MKVSQVQKKSNSCQRWSDLYIYTHTQKQDLRPISKLPTTLNISVVKGGSLLMDQNHVLMTHFQFLSFFVNFYCLSLFQTRKEKEKLTSPCSFLIYKVRSSQYGSPQNRTCYTKVMKIFHTFMYPNDIRILIYVFINKNFH